MRVWSCWSCRRSNANFCATSGSHVGYLARFMDPLPPHDPLWKLLGHARPVQPRGNFVANVLREVRNTPQERGLWARIAAAWDSLAVVPVMVKAGALACAVALTVALWPAASDTMAEQPVAAVVESALSDEDLALLADTEVLPIQRLDDFDALVSVTDTSTLTDRELALLFY
jgi:anti-sigma-K factor RskA